jgi:hypothetical protein
MIHVGNLTDRQGIRIATIYARPDGRLAITDKHGNLKGTYDSKIDRSYDAKGNLVGGGNWLSALLLDGLVSARRGSP